jgi:hypothetical protein
VLAGPAWRRARDFPAGGHPALLAERTVNLALNLVRRALTDPGTPPSQ